MEPGEAQATLLAPVLATALRADVATRGVLAPAVALAAKEQAGLSHVPPRTQVHAAVSARQSALWAHWDLEDAAAAAAEEASTEAAWRPAAEATEVPWEEAGRRPARGGGGVRPPGCDKAALVQCIKDIQRSSDRGRRAWWAFCTAGGAPGFDPERQMAPFLMRFVAGFQEPR